MVGAKGPARTRIRRPIAKSKYNHHIKTRQDNAVLCHSMRPFFRTCGRHDSYTLPSLLITLPPNTERGGGYPPVLTVQMKCRILLNTLSVLTVLYSHYPRVLPCYFASFFFFGKSARQNYPRALLMLEIHYSTSFLQHQPRHTILHATAHPTTAVRR